MRYPATLAGTDPIWRQKQPRVKFTFLIKAGRLFGKRWFVNAAE